MTYRIIEDRDKLLAFIDWLPNLEPGEKFYCSLFARKKYAKGDVMSSDKAQLRRFLSDKERLYNKIEQLEVKFGAYQVKSGAVPQEALAFYINPNPRGLEKATYDSILQLTTILKNKRQNYNPQQEVMSCIQRSVGRKLYLDFDIDDADFDLARLQGLINPSALTILKTRGGFHVLVRLDRVEEVYKKTFYRDITVLGVDQVGDQLLPVPGCVQGGFVPRFVEWNGGD